jgi:hypothetical protein
VGDSCIGGGGIAVAPVPATISSARIGMFWLREGLESVSSGLAGGWGQRLMVRLSCWVLGVGLLAIGPMPGTLAQQHGLTGLTRDAFVGAALRTCNAQQMAAPENVGISKPLLLASKRCGDFESPLFPCTNPF